MHDKIQAGTKPYTAFTVRNGAVSGGYSTAKFNHYDRFTSILNDVINCNMRKF